MQFFPLYLLSLLWVSNHERACSIYFVPIDVCIFVGREAGWNVLTAPCLSHAALFDSGAEPHAVLLQNYRGHSSTGFTDIEEVDLK